MVERGHAPIVTRCAKEHSGNRFLLFTNECNLAHRILKVVLLTIKNRMQDCLVSLDLASWRVAATRDYHTHTHKSKSVGSHQCTPFPCILMALCSLRKRSGTNRQCPKNAQELNSATAAKKWLEGVATLRSLISDQPGSPLFARIAN